jgi:hypothetical protein
MILPEFVEIRMNKRKYCIKRGYEFIFIIDKNYTGFEKIIYNNE